jgi:hypothetical protein
MGASICWGATDAGTQLSVFDSSALEKQLPVFQDAMVKSKSSRREPDFSNGVLSIPKFSADSLPFGIISNALSIVLTLARLLDHFSDL